MTVEAKRRAVPARTLEQRMASLEYANRFRVARADTKRRVRSGDLTVTDILTGPTDPLLEGMTVNELLRKVPKWGPVKARRMMVRCGIIDSRTLGGLPDYQRDLLLSHLAGR